LQRDHAARACCSDLLARSRVWAWRAPRQQNLFFQQHIEPCLHTPADALTEHPSAYPQQQLYSRRCTSCLRPVLRLSTTCAQQREGLASHHLSSKLQAALPLLACCSSCSAACWALGRPVSRHVAQAASLLCPSWAAHQQLPLASAMAGPAAAAVGSASPTTTAAL
jgi:hypothetical protein